MKKKLAKIFDTLFWTSVALIWGTLIVLLVYYAIVGGQ